MTTTIDRLNKLIDTKESIRQAIINKGVSVPTSTPFADYPSKISAIESEGGSDSFFALRTNNNTNYKGLFAYSDFLTELDVSSFNTSNVTDMGYMFSNCTGLTTINGLENFNTSLLTNMDRMFNYCSKLTSLNLNSFNTSSVTNMSYMFSYCRALTSLNLNSFNTSNVTNMKYMFSSCSNLTSLDLSNFNTSNVTDMSYMFEYCSKLTELDLSNFDLTKCTSSSACSVMLRSCTSLHTLRLDNCNNNTINKIITSSSFPTGTITGVTRTIYCKESEASGLTAPTNWVFSYV